MQNPLTHIHTLSPYLVGPTVARAFPLSALVSEEIGTQICPGVVADGGLRHQTGTIFGRARKKWNRQKLVDGRNACLW